MNERIFNYEHSAASHSNQSDLLTNPLFKEPRQKYIVTTTGKVNTASKNNEAWKKDDPISTTTNIVIKTKQEVPKLDSLAESNFYYAQHARSISEREVLRKA